MAYDEQLAGRVRAIFVGHPSVVEKKMFGGLAFMVQGHMACGVTGERLMARVGPDAHDACLAEAHVREMDFTGRPMRGFVFVDPGGVAADADLVKWVERTVTFVKTLPPK